LRRGVELEDGRTRPAIVDVVETEERASWLELIVTEGRNRLVRRMCEAVDHRPLRVVRSAFATIELGDLRPGQYRYLAQREIDALYRAAELPPPAITGDRVEELGLKKLGDARRRKGALPGEERATAGAQRGTKPPRARRPKRPRSRG
jgi:hypothetical protein